MHVTAVIPARFASVRFPGKMLADRTGWPLIQHVYERARQASSVDEVIVATDDDRIAEAVKAFGGRAVMTGTHHENGTSRIAEAATSIASDIIVNVQGDEPEIEPVLIDVAVGALQAHADCGVATVASPFASGEDVSNPNIVKVVVDQEGRAMLFSRAVIPHDRDKAGTVGHLKHVGLYVYRREFLGRYPSMKPTPLEAAERLEQLRFLEHGERIAVAIGRASSAGIDTPEQYEAFVQRYNARQGAHAG